MNYSWIWVTLKKVILGFPDLNNQELDDIACEHRLAMISYLSRGKEKIQVNEDTVWSAIRGGNSHIAKLLQQCAVDSAFSWVNFGYFHFEDGNGFKSTWCNTVCRDSTR